MKRARKVRLHESEDISEGDRHGRKYSKGTGQHRDKIQKDKMALYPHSFADEPAPHQCSKSRHSHDKHTSDNTSRDAQFASRTRQHRTVSPDSDSSDEILIKGKASRRARRHTDKNVSRQLRGIEKANLDVLRSSSASSGEIHIHFVPVVTNSASPPLTESRRSSSRSSSGSKSTRVNVSIVTSQLKGLTKSWLGRYSNDSQKTSRPSRTKHEKRDKHGKKRVPVSQYLAPLAQRWVCYGCGKVRSGTIQARHPLQEGHKMHPNWCGKCRVHGELQGRPCSFEGKRHYCWGCGIVRSQTYNDDNPLQKEDMSEPNYCRPCRESSPTFNRSLREASEAGSTVSILDKAFTRAMHDAELSEVEQESDDQGTSAPGKENQDPRPRKKKLKASDSFMLENFSYKVKTTSDASSADDGVPISILKALYLDKERSRSTSGGGCRLSGSSYQPPVVESDVSEECKPGLTVREPMEPPSEVSHYDTMSPKKSHRGEELFSPTTVLPYKQHDSDDSDIKKKKVHWYKQAPKSTATDSNASDSAYCSNRLSDITNASNGSTARRVRRGPGEYSTGSPPVYEGETTAGDLSHDVRKQENASIRRPVTRGKGLKLNLPTEGTFGRPSSGAESDIASHRHDSTESGNTHSTPPTPPEAYIDAAPDFEEYAAGAAYDKPVRGWNASPEFPIFSRPYLSPKKQRSKASRKTEPIYRPVYDTHASNMQEYSSYQSAAHFGDSTRDRDFSGFGAPSEEYAMHNDQYGRRSSPVQHGARPHRDCPIHEDYNAGTVQNDREWAGSYGEDHNSPLDSTGYAAFDFSGFGAASSEVHESVSPVEETFVRKKKKTGQKKTSQSTPKTHTWHLYDDGENLAGNEPNPEGFSWRRDGRTTVHRSGGGNMPNEGKTVHILSIREMRSDEELTVSDDYDEASVIGTVMADGKPMKFICEA